MNSSNLEIPDGWKSQETDTQQSSNEPTDEQIQFRLDWLDKIDDFGMSQQELNQVMEEDLGKWIEYCNSKGWDAEAIDRAIGLA
jgi:uncharacterized protein YqiB (DUF1249 family)